MGGCGCLASTNVLEDRGDDIGIFDAGDDAQFAAALGAGLDVDGEDAFRAPHPGHGGKGLVRLFVARFTFWHDGLTMLAIRREHAVEPGEVQSRARDQRRRAGDEVEWVEDDMGGAVAKRLLEPMDDLSPIVGREPLVGDGGPFRELGASRPWCPMKRRAASFEIAHPVEKEHMEVNVEVRRRTEPLDQGDRTGLGAGGDGEPRLFDEASRDRTVDAQDLAQYLRPGGEQEA